MPACSQCGADQTLETCADLFDKLLTLDHSRRSPWSRTHGPAVAAYRLQHPAGITAEGRAFLGVLLSRFVDQGGDGFERWAADVRRQNSHRAGGWRPKAGLPAGSPQWEVAPGPTAYGVTISRVSVDGTFPAQGHVERVRLWACDVLAAWSRANP